ncbi:hypothetical protein [Cognatilysobacter bugurensis]|uniref:Uncharacterized protein n=1 Tax=Cognatilysobacter bugurensis TaxID=543356 RepID=A0A918WAB4_9GAMM|nr:hypothetical protein [Lysobacter bugurensis]GHA84755.1 hypothetical protein GCM10007067_23370 [Lysobacter bugurensis]
MREASVDPVSKPRPGRGFLVFKWAVYALLALNVALYATHGTLTETFDTAAWLVLLLLFEWETGGWSGGSRRRRVAHGARALASLVIAWACSDYALQREWLDFANAATWLAVVAALELEVRVPAGRRRFHHARRSVTWALYAALVGFIAAWLVLGSDDVGGAWLDAWDATLWLAAFVVIELNLFDRAPRSASAHQ